MDFKYLCHINGRNDIKCKYILMFPLKNLACKELNGCGLGLIISQKYGGKYKILTFSSCPLDNLGKNNMLPLGNFSLSRAMKWMAWINRLEFFISMKIQNDRMNKMWTHYRDQHKLRHNIGNNFQKYLFFLQYIKQWRPIKTWSSIT